MFDFILGKDVNKILEKARSFEDQGENKKALDHLDKESRNREEYAIYLELGRMQAKMNMPIATRNLTNAHMLAPENIQNTISRAEDGFFLGNRIAEVSVFIATLYLELGDFDKANDFLKDVPKDYISKEIAAKNAVLNNFPVGTTNTKKRASLLLSIASLTLYTDKESAINLFEEIASEFPDKADLITGHLAWTAKSEYRSPLSHIYLGKFYLNFGREREAIDSFSKALQIDPGCADKIITILESKTQLGPESMDYLFNLYINTNNQDKALELVNRSNLSKEIEQKYLKSMLQTDRKNIKARMQYIDQLMTEKKFAEASSELEFFADKTEYLGWISEKISTLLQSPNEQIYYLSAEVFMKKGDYDGCVDIAEKLLKEYPESLDRIETYLLDITEQNLENHKALFLLGMINSQRGTVDKAILISDFLLFSGKTEEAAYAYEICSSLMERFPDNLKLNVSFILSAAFKNLGLAIKKSESLLDRDESSIIELLIKIDILSEIYPEISENLHSIASVFTEKIQRQDISLIAEILSSIKSENPENALKYIQILNRSYQDLKDLTTDLLEKVSSKFPKNKEVLKNNIIILLRKKNLSSALDKLRDLMDYPKEDTWTLDLFKKLKNHYPDDYRVLFGYLDFLLKRKLFSQLEIEMEKIPEKLPPEDKSYFNLIRGQVAFETGNVKSGLNHISKSLDLSSKFSDQIIELLEKIRKTSEDPKILYILSKAYSRSGKYENSSALLFELYTKSYVSPDKVIKEFQFQLQGAPTDASLRFYLGKILSSEGELDKAAVEFQLAVSYDESFAIKSLEEMEKIITNSDSEKNLGIMISISDICQRFDVLYSTIKKIISNNPSNRSITEFSKKKIHTDPEKTIYKLIWAEICIRNDRFDEAIDILLKTKTKDLFEAEVLTKLTEEIIDKGFLNPDIFLKHGILAAEQGLFEKAVDSFSRAFDLNNGLGDEILPHLQQIDDYRSDVLRCFIMAEKSNFDQCASILKNIEESLPESVIKEILFRFSKMQISGETFDLHIVLLGMMIRKNMSQQAVKKAEALEKADLSVSQKEQILNLALDYVISHDRKKSMGFVKSFREIVGPEKFFQWTNEKRIEEIKRVVKSSDRLSLAKKIRLSGFPQIALEVLKSDTTEEAKLEKCECMLALGDYPLAINLVKTLKPKSENMGKISKILIACHAQMSDFVSALSVMKSGEKYLNDKEKKLYSEFAGKILSDSPSLIYTKIRKKSSLLDEKTIQKAIEEL
ncbi:tetratricopeptide repeat protein [candidate division WOR-3 bacterium]|nr:tetratricopeptide repeat protein [candidate division WOR-3 bacterium]